MRSPGDAGSLRGTGPQSLTDRDYPKGLWIACWPGSVRQRLRRGTLANTVFQGLSDGIFDFLSPIFNSKPSKLPWISPKHL